MKTTKFFKVILVFFFYKKESYGKYKIQTIRSEADIFLSLALQLTVAALALMNYTAADHPRHFVGEDLGFSSVPRAAVNTA